MHNRYTWVAAFALAVILAGCNQAPPPPAPDTHDADVKAIRDAETAGVQAMAAKDVDKLGAFYADDASMFNPDAPVLNGMAAIKAFWKPLLADKNFSLTDVLDKVDVAKSGDLGYSQSAFTMTMTDPKTKNVLAVKGKEVVVYKKQTDGSWKAVADIGNEDAPPTAAKK
jgi:ketosteroid isomerase-like protein